MSNTKELNIESVAASHEEVTLVDGKEQKVHKLIVRLDIGDDIVQLLLNEIKKLSVEVEGLRAKLNRIA